MYKVSSTAINRFRGLAISTAGRNISWEEIAKKANITSATLRNIRSGRSTGSLKTINALTSVFREYNVSIDPEDLFTEVE